MRSSFRFYGFAALSSAVALALTLLIDDPLTEPNTLLIFLGGVMCSSWYGGLGPGILATGLSALAFASVYLPPPFSFNVAMPGAAVRLVEFVAVCLLISVLNELRCRSQHRAEMARAEAEGANRVKDDFLAMISHDLRTPLSAIVGWTDALRARGPDPAILNRALEGIERNAKAEVKLVEDLLDLSRITAGKLRLQIALCDVAEVLQASIDTLRPALNAKEIALASTVPRGTAFVTGDMHRLQQVFWNLLSNAVKFTAERGRITIHLERSHSHARIVIEDTGCGIDPTLLPYVFDRFRQGDGAEVKRHAGLGLGLSIAQHIVELHGGTIRADSEGVGCGATFTIELPVMAGNAQEIVAA